MGGGGYRGGGSVGGRAAGGWVGGLREAAGGLGAPMVGVGGVPAVGVKVVVRVAARTVEAEALAGNRLALQADTMAAVGRVGRAVAAREAALRVVAKAAAAREAATRVVVVMAREAAVKAG